MHLQAVQHQQKASQVSGALAANSYAIKYGGTRISTRNIEKILNKSFRAKILNISL
jgi:hypothetical protein